MIHLIKTIVGKGGVLTILEHLLRFNFGDVWDVQCGVYATHHLEYDIQFGSLWTLDPWRYLRGVHRDGSFVEGRGKGEMGDRGWQHASS